MLSKIFFPSASSFLLGVILLASVAPASVQAQIQGKSVNVFTTDAGKVLHVGDTIRIGRGSNADGTFKYIFIPSNVFTGTPQKFFTSEFAGSYARIKDLKATNSSTYGIQTVAVIKGEGMLSGCIILNSAENVGELRTKPAQRQAVAAALIAASPATASVTDELLKLKQLLDAKAITPAEFAAQKSKILNSASEAPISKAVKESGKTQSDNDIDFKLLSAVGNKKNQTVTVVIKITNKAANKEGFTTMIKSFSNPDGEEFAIKSSMIGKEGGFKTLFTDAPIQGTYVFGGVLPKVTTIKMLPVPYQLLKGMYETYRVEFRDVSIDWK